VPTSARFDAEIYTRSTPRQRRSPKGGRHEAQRQDAAIPGLILLMAGTESPEALTRVLALPPALGSLGLFLVPKEDALSGMPPTKKEE
jgi:hypothetical protein